MLILLSYPDVKDLHSKNEEQIFLQELMVENAVEMYSLPSFCKLFEMF